MGKERVMDINQVMVVMMAHKMDGIKVHLLVKVIMDIPGAHLRLLAVVVLLNKVIIQLVIKVLLEINGINKCKIGRKGISNGKVGRKIVDSKIVTELLITNLVGNLLDSPRV